MKRVKNASYPTREKCTSHYHYHAPNNPKPCFLISKFSSNSSWSCGMLTLHILLSLSKLLWHQATHNEPDFNSKLHIFLAIQATFCSLGFFIPKLPSCSGKVTKSQPTFAPVAAESSPFQRKALHYLSISLITLAGKIIILHQ